MSKAPWFISNKSSFKVTGKKYPRNSQYSPGTIHKINIMMYIKPTSNSSTVLSLDVKPDLILNVIIVLFWQQNI